MKCPRCGLEISDRVDKCQGCDFHISELGKRMRYLPHREGNVNDFAKTLSDAGKRKIQSRIDSFQARYRGELVLVTVQSTAPLKPSEFVFWLFNRWDIGGEKNEGLLILLAMNERRVECEVGYGWEYIVSDLESGEILDAFVVPLLKEGKFDEALYLGVDKLASLIENELMVDG
jgi:uncharacterized protein